MFYTRLYYGYYSYCYIMFLNKETKKMYSNNQLFLPIAINYYQLSSFNNTTYYRNYHTKLKSIIYSK